MKPTRVLTTAAVLLVSALLLACPVGRLRVVIPDFESSVVRGVELLRVEDGSGAVAPAGSIQFKRLKGTAETGEVLVYRQHDVDGEPMGRQEAPVVRDPDQPDSIQVEFWFLNELPSGWFKVATFNGAGTSPPSAGQKYVEGSTG
ncbi:MAG: hypothetical protein ABFS41_07160 [Myxococcota bacterium]